MSLLINVLLERQSTSYNYGFTIRHTTVYPFEDGYDSCMMGDYDTNEAYDNEIPVNSAVISRVEPLSCAYNAGLRCGDRILCINDEAISDLSYEQICDIIRTSGTELRVMIVSGCSSSGSNSTSATEQQSKTPSLSISSSRSDRHISNSSRTSTSNHNNAIDNQNNSSLIYTPHLNSPQIYQAPQRRIASLYGDGRSWLTTAGSSVHSSAVIRGANIASGSSSTSPLMSSVSNTRLNDSLPSRYTATSNFSKVMNQNQINRTDNNRPVSSSSLLSNSMYNNYNRPNMNAMSNQRILSPFNGTVHRPYAVQPNRLRAAVSTDNFSTNRFSNQLDYNENNYGGRYPPPPYHVASRFSREAHSRFLAPNALDAKRLQKFQSPSFSTNNNVALGSGGELRNGRSGAEPQRAVATVKLASPDSWMRNCTTRPISPSVPHNFNPNWRRSALAYPEYNQPSDTMKEEDNKDRKEIENRSGEKYGSHQAVNISASNKGIIPINIRTTSNDNNIVKMRNDSTAQKDSNKRHAGSNWEQEFIEESDENGNIPVQFYNPVTSQQRADINTSGPSSKFGRFAPRQASFIAAISGTERNTINNSDSHNNNQTSQLSQSSKQQQVESVHPSSLHSSYNQHSVMTVLPASAPSYRLSAGIAVQDECARRTPPSYVLNGKVGGASPPSVTRITLGSSYTMKPTSATTSQPPQSSSSSTFRNTAHRLLCGASRYGSSDDHSSSPIPYESSSSSVQLKSYDELDDNGERVENADGNNGAPRCVEQIANSNNYLRMTKQLRRHDKSAQQRRHLRLSAPSFLTSSATATDWAQSTSFQSNSQQHRHECYYPQKPPLPEQARDHLRRPNSTTHAVKTDVGTASFESKKSDHINIADSYSKPSANQLNNDAVQSTTNSGKNAATTAESVLLTQLRALASSANSLATYPPSNDTKTTTNDSSNKRVRPKSCVMATSSPISPLSASDSTTSLIASSGPSVKTGLSTSSTFESKNCLSDTSLRSSSNLVPSSSSSKSIFNQKNATSSVQHPQPTTHRIQRFITFFSSNDHQNKQQHSSGSLASPSSGYVGKQYVKRSTTGVLNNSSSAHSLFIPIKAKDVRKQGQLIHQETALGDSSKYDPRRWEQCWAVLHAYNLYLCRQLSSYVSDESQEKILNIPADSLTIDIRSSIVDIAYELRQRKDEQRAHVLRVVTQRRTEHLLQAESEGEMLKWIDNIRNASSSYVLTNAAATAAAIAPPADNKRATTTPTLHRARATKANSADSIFLEKPIESERSLESSAGLRGDIESSSPCEAAISPSSSSRSDLHAICNGRNKLSSSPTSATTELIMQRYRAKSTHLNSPSASKRHQSVGDTSSPAAAAAGHNMLPGTSSASSEGATTSNGQCDASTGVSTTPKSARKWKKSKAAKQASSLSSSGKSDRSNLQSTSALGQRIVDCPTSGEGDQVPLLIRMCVQVVESYGMDTVGIYRIPGNTAAVNALKETLNNGFENVDFTDPRWRDVNVVSSLLKMFLRKLPEPLLTDKHYPFFIDANRIASHPQRLHKLRNLVRKLPSAHYATLKYLIAHLRAVVAHSYINKMETRNLALMFGPSIVRPSDDNMATMVTHMSDQCKIIETFITYYDWMFNDAGTADDEVPEPVPSACDAAAAASQGGGIGGSGAEGGDPLAPGAIMTTSFNDMHNLLRRVNEAEAIAMMDAQRGGKIKHMLNVRRNSKKDKSKKREREHSAHTTTTHHQHITNIAPTTSGSVTAPSSASVEQSFSGLFQERDIDAEIANRRQRTTTNASITTTSSIEHSPSVDSSLGSMGVDSTNKESDNHNLSSNNTQSSLLSSSDVDAMRRKRQQDICSARRIFIAGTDADPGENGGLAQVDLDDLVSHTRHLNLETSPAVEVLSAETREKIRRLQQLQGWLPASADKKSTDSASARREVNINEEDKTPTKTKTTEEFSSTDALSLTSDYSTTSSAALMIPVAVSCVDHLAATSSDYASSDVSPCTRNASVSPRNPDEHDSIQVLQLSSSPRIIGATLNIHPANAKNIDYELESEPKCDHLLTTGQYTANLPPRERRLSENFNNNNNNKRLPETHVMFRLQEEDTSSTSSSTASKGLSKVRVRSKIAARKDLWRRHTLSDVDMIRQALAEDENRKMSASNRVVGEKVVSSSSSSSKVGKLARWIKNNFRRSSPDLNVNDQRIMNATRSSVESSLNDTTPPSGATPATISNSHVPTPPSEVIPSSGDEQL